MIVVAGSISKACAALEANDAQQDSAHAAAAIYRHPSTIILLPRLKIKTTRTNDSGRSVGQPLTRQTVRLDC
jgi:hypothetical protein